MKLDGWEKRLADYLQEDRNGVFVWGQRDCVLLAVDVIGLQTGINLELDVNGGIRGTYATREEALARMRYLGISPHFVFDMKFKRVLTGFAGRGDIVYRKRDSGGSFGVVYSGKAMYRAESGGYVFEPVALADVVWKIE